MVKIIMALYSIFLVEGRLYCKSSVLKLIPNIDAHSLVIILLSFYWTIVMRKLVAALLKP